MVSNGIDGGATAAEGDRLWSEWMARRTARRIGGTSWRGPGLGGAVMALTVAALGTPSRADESGSGVDVKELTRQMEEMRSELKRTKAVVEELRAATGDHWLTEQRAEEVRTLVADVLADADTRASSLQSGMTAGWSEHFFLSSPDGRFKLQFEGQLQPRFIYNFLNDPDRHRSGFEITRTKLTMRGHLFSPDLTFLVRTDQTRNEPGLVNGLYFVRDLWVALRLNNEWSMRVGQFKLPFNREELVSSAYQLAVERSLVNEGYNLGRSQGVELTYADDTAKVSMAFSDGAVDSVGGFGIIGRNPVNTAALNEDTEWAATLRWERLIAGEWRQFADFTSPIGGEYGMLLGFGAHWERSEANGLGTFRRNEARWVALTTDLSVEWGGANAFLSAVYHWLDTPNVNLNAWGFVAQYGMYLSPKWEIFGRWEYAFFDTPSADFTNLSVLTLGANYYIDGHDVKLTIDMGFGLDAVDQPFDFDIAGYRLDQAESEPQIVFRTQFQLLF